VEKEAKELHGRNMDGTEGTGDNPCSSVAEFIGEIPAVVFAAVLAILASMKSPIRTFNQTGTPCAGTPGRLR
jgi:hypothetical protein